MACLGIPITKITPRPWKRSDRWFPTTHYSTRLFVSCPSLFAWLDHLRMHPSIRWSTTYAVVGQQCECLICTYTRIVGASNSWWESAGAMGGTIASTGQRRTTDCESDSDDTISVYSMRATDDELANLSVGNCKHHVSRLLCVDCWVCDSARWAHFEVGFMKTCDAYSCLSW